MNSDSMNYRKINNLVGWLTGSIAFIVYLKTMEPTASFWDCGEFLSCAYKLEVGHSPGAPFFMLLQRLFGMLGDSTLAGAPSVKAALFINSMSALVSALTILFLFWTITHFAKKTLTSAIEKTTIRQTLLIMGAGLVGALAYTFSDTFWFSAVEAEVYATSSFFTAFTFWAILKWENVADNKYADRWLVLIAYLTGISVGIHLLNLLAIPAVTMVYYFRRYEATLKGSIMAFVMGCVILAFVQFGIIQYIPIIASWFDVHFTNEMGLPFDTGSITSLLLFTGLIVWLLFFAKRKTKYILHTSVLCVLFIFIGYSSYIVPIIRSRANTPIDMTNPDNALTLKSYVSREQFGDQPLLRGQDFNSPVIDIKDDGAIYEQAKKNGKDYYEKVGTRESPIFDPATLRFFPRIYENSEASHAQFYRSYLGLDKDATATSADNFSYFIRYQMNWMWWRYFLWNYAGRQNDMEGQGEPKNGNWISGIPFIDKIHGVGDIDKMGSGYRDNPARNQLYFLPLLLGILGMIYHFNKDRKDAFVVFILFFFTGAAIGIYLNMPPLQPRERDYAFAGATYAFAIWIGFGVLMVNELLQKTLKKASVIVSIILCLLMAPLLMAKEEWNDHDRSGKTLARTTAYNTLISCAPNAVLFTYGDNDTYPLWYIQEIEGLRKDVRIINTSLLGIGWYVDQMNYKINDADAVPMVWEKKDYVAERKNFIRYNQTPDIPKDKYFNLEEICKFIASDDPNNKIAFNRSGEAENYLPSKNFFVPGMSKGDLLKKGLISANDTNLITNEMKFSFPKDVVYKSDLTILNIVAAVAKQGWNRPLYFDAGLPSGNYAGMSDYMRLEGLVYRLLPYKYIDKTQSNASEMGSIDIDKSYKLFMNTYIWGGCDRNDVYFDEKNRIMFYSYRMNATQIANGLYGLGKRNEAEKVLDKVVNSITEHSYFYDISGFFLANAYYEIDAKEKGKKIAVKVAKNAEDDLEWTKTLNEEGQQQMAVHGDILQDIRVLNSIGNILKRAGDSVLANGILTKSEAYIKEFEPLLKTEQER